MTPARYEPGEVLPGTVYRVVRHLATGGMGTVYEVEDTTVEKRYVLKTLHPQLVAREDLARRMRDEAKSLARLQHPNIVDVITAGVTTDRLKMPFYVMERLIGQNLRTVLQKKQVLDRMPAFKIAIDVLDALAHAHANSIVHRDVKPENIFLHRNTQGTTTTKLLDFGIVRLLDRDASKTSGKFIGTLRYASPEQITGRAIGPSSDIYSLGLVLYEMLCGRGPYDDVGDGYAIGAAHAGRAPPPLSQFAVVDPEVETLVMRSLAKEPQGRPAGCSSFAAELRRMVRDGEPPASETELNAFSAVPSTLEGMPPPTAPEDDADAPVSPIAPTLAAEMEPFLRPTPTPTPGGAAGGGPIDRDAPTRASAPTGATQRIPSNDTRMEDPSGLSAAPASALGRSLRSSAGDGLGLGLESGNPNMTGPLSGEAPTRPPERGVLVAVVAAVVVAFVVGVSALVWLRTRPRVAKAVEPPAVVSVSSPVPVPVLVPVPASPSASALASASDSAPAPAPAPATSGGAGAARPARHQGAPARPAASPRGGTPPAIGFDP